MRKIYVVWGYTDNDTENDLEVLGIFSSLHLAEQRLLWRNGKEYWDSQSITAYAMNNFREPEDDGLSWFIRRVEVKDLPLPETDEDMPDGN